MLPTFAQNVTLQEPFETAAQINEELKRTEFSSEYIIFLQFSLNVENWLRNDLSKEK